jgi:hypothetical protein
MADPYTGSWLRHAKEEFIDNLRLRLGCDLDSDSTPRYCVCSGGTVGPMFDINQNPLHALCCPQAAFHKGKNHKTLDSLLRTFIGEVVGPTVEISQGECNFNPDELQHLIDRVNEVNIRADIRVKFNGLLKYIDVGVTCPATKALKHSAAVETLIAAKTYSKIKINKYANYLNDTAMANLVPFIVETTGALGADAQDFIRVIKRNSYYLTNKKEYKRMYNKFRHNQIMCFAKTLSKMVRLGYVNQKVIPLTI